MRVSGVVGFEEYVRRYGRTMQIDRWIASDLRDGYLEFDLYTETIHITDLGRRHCDNLAQQRAVL